jgi:hypothetical protein
VYTVFGPLCISDIQRFSESVQNVNAKPASSSAVYRFQGFIIMNV